MTGRGALTGLLVAVLVAVACLSAPPALRAEDDRLLVLGRDYYNMGRLADALGTLRKLLKDRPDDVEGLFYLGLIYRDTKHLDKAVAYFSRVVELSPDHKGARDELVKVHLAQARQFRQDGAMDDCVAELQKPLRLGILSLDAAVELLAILDDRKRWGDIRTLVRRFEAERSRVTGNDELWGTLRYMAGLAAKQEGDYDDAEEWLLKAVNSLREHPNARPLYEQVKLIQKKRLLPIIRTGDRHAKAGRFAEALLAYRQALSIDADNKAVTEKVGRLTEIIESRKLLDDATKFERDGRWAEARQALEKASGLDQGNAEILVALKRVEDTMARNQALRLAEEARVSAESKARQTRFNDLLATAEAAFTRGDYAASEAAYRSALEVNPGDKLVEEKLQDSQRKARLYEQFQTGERYARQGNNAAAIKEFLELEKLDAEFRGVRKRLGMAFLAAEQYEQAEKYLRLYLDKFPRDEEALYQLAEVYRAQVDRNPTNLRRALAQYEEVRKLNPDYADVNDKVAALSWEVHKVKYALIVVVILGIVLGSLYVKVRPARLRAAYLRRLDRLAAKEKWEPVKAMFESFKEHSFGAMEEAQARLIFAQAFYETQGYQRCIKECQELNRLKRLTQKSRPLMARSLYAMKTISPEVLDLYLELIEKELDNMELRRFVGQFCLEKKIINPTTMSLLKQLALQCPEDDHLRSLLIRGFVKDGDRSAIAMNLFRVEREKNPDNLEVRCAVAEDLLKNDKVEDAVRECEEILNANLNHRPTHELLLAAYERLGKLDQLAKTYQSILEHDPHNAVIHHYLQRILHPEGRPQVAPGMSSGTIPVAGGGWEAQMPGGFLVQQEAAAAGAAPAAGAGAAGDGTASAMVCRSCGREVPAGTYFCECGQPL